MPVLYVMFGYMTLCYGVLYTGVLVVLRFGRSVSLSLSYYVKFTGTIPLVAAERERPMSMGVGRGHVYD